MSVLRNPVLLLAWGLPLAAVVASFLTLGIVLRHPDGELPEQYHWEGFQLDRDFSRGERATELRVRAKLVGLGNAGECTIELHTTGAAPDALALSLAHATLPALDQQVRLHRVHIERELRNGPAIYRGICRAAPAGHWRLELIDAAHNWAVRGSVHGRLDTTTLDAGSAAAD